MYGRFVPIIKRALASIPVKVLVAVGSIVLTVVAIVAAFALRSGTSAPASAPPATVLPAHRRSGFPTPPHGAVVFSRQMGGDALALGVMPKSGHMLLQASVLGAQGAGVSG